MKRITIIFATAVASLGTLAQTNESFNSRSQSKISEVKGYLQNNCWQFSDFEINNGGWNPGIDGDGAMVSGTGSSNTGIYSQLLSTLTDITVSFKYKFNNNVTQRRWLKILLTDGNNNVINQLDSIELTGLNNSSIYSFNKSFSVPTGKHKIYIGYNGIGGLTRIAIDNLSYSASTYYSNGCNKSPVASNDYISGFGNHTATGNVLANDVEADKENLTAILVTNSLDGNVVMGKGGLFNFTPNPNFTGLSTSFTYMACDNSAVPLCSKITNVIINFPKDGTLPSSIVDLGAIFNGSRVVVKWVSTFELNSERFEIERSIDGANFKVVGSVKSNPNSSVKREYLFEDDMKNSTFNKNDLYYRIKQINTDKKTAYTKVLVVRVFHTKSLQSVSISPNPAFNDIKVNLELKENSYIVLKVSNNNGNEIMRTTTRGITGTNNLTLENTSHLQAGVYFLEVIVNSNERMMIKLIKS